MAIHSAALRPGHLWPRPSLSRVALAAAILLALLGFGWVIGYVAAHDELASHKVVLGLLGLAVLPILLLHLELSSVVFAAMLWARVSDVAVDQYGAPSIAAPLGTLLISAWFVRKVAAGERIGWDVLHDLAPVVPYALLLLASAIWADLPDRALDRLSLLIKDVLIFWGLTHMLRDPRAARGAAWALVVTAALLGAVSLHQQFTHNFTSNYGGFAQTEKLSIVGNTEGFRLGGPLNSPNFFALVLLVTVPIGLALLRMYRGWLERLALGGMLLAIGATVILTYSRAGMLIMAGAVLLMVRGVRIRPWHLLVAGLLLPLALVAVPPQVWGRLGTLTAEGKTGAADDPAVALRLGAQQAALELFQTHPVVGIGAGNFPPHYPETTRALGVKAVDKEFYPHNLYLEILSETGVAGILAYALLIGVPLWDLRRARLALARVPIAARTGGLVQLAYGLEAAMLAYLAGMFFLHSAFPRYQWLLLALIVAATHAMRTVAHRTAQPRPVVTAPEARHITPAVGVA